MNVRQKPTTTPDRHDREFTLEDMRARMIGWRKEPSIGIPGRDTNRERRELAS